MIAPGRISASGEDGSVALPRSRRGPARLRTPAVVACLLLALALVPMAVLHGCAAPKPSGVVHVVRKGENLYRIGLRYGVPAERIARRNGIRDVTALSVGTRLVIPGVVARSTPGSEASRRRAADMASAAKLARQESMRRAKLEFQWPVRGRLTSRFGPRNGRRHEGIDLAAVRGTAIGAAEDGRVIHSGRLGDYGKAVIVSHRGDYRSVYAHANRTYVRKGQLVRKGQKIAEVGSTGRSTGPHLHFEIRIRESPRDPMLYLP